MSISAIRRLVLAVATLALVSLLAISAIPFMASTTLVRDRIALELSNLSGLRVTLGAAPEIDIWPVFRARLQRVTFQEWGPQPRTLIEADSVETELSGIAALRGYVVLTAVQVERPTVHLFPGGWKRGGDDAYDTGRVAQGIEAARQAIRANQANPDTRSLPSDELGSIEFRNGRVVNHARGREGDAVTSLSGRIGWPALNRAATVNASGIWRGEMVTLDASAERPLLLAAGGTSPLKIALNSPPMNLTFEGNASQSGEGFVDGTGRFSAPSLRRMQEWTKTDILPTNAIGPVSIGGRVTGNLAKLKIAEASVSLDNNQATGSLDLLLGQAVPSMAGTLAFDTIDLRTLLNSFSALMPDEWGRYRAIDENAGATFGMDLRLSANRATAGSLVFTNLAATAQVREGLAAFDISDATAFGGTVQAGMRVDRKFFGADVELRLMGDNVDMGALAKTVQVNEFIPISRGRFSVSLKGRGDDLYDVLRTASGSATASFGQGAMAGVDFGKFIARARQADFFPLPAVGPGTLNFNSIELKANVTDGTARIERGEIATPGGLVSLQGLMTLASRGLALSGRIDKLPDNQPPLTFFVGGSSESPFVSPITMPNIVDQ